VMEQQNTFATGLKPFHRKLDDFAQRDTMVPVVGYRV
jgi:hypothetical protein